MHYRDTIQSMYNRWMKQQHQDTHINSHSHVNDRWLSTPQKKEKALHLKSELKKSTKKNLYLEQRIKESIEKDSIEIDQELNNGLQQIMCEYCEYSISQNSRHCSYGPYSRKLQKET